MSVTIDKHVEETVFITPDKDSTVYVRAILTPTFEGRHFVIRVRNGEPMGAYVTEGENLERVRWQYLSVWDERGYRLC